MTQRAIVHHSRRLHLRPEDIADISQAAALLLLRTIARGVPVISGEWIAPGAIAAWCSANRRHVGPSLGEWADGVPAKNESIRVDGVSLTMADARMDSSALVELWTNGIGMAAVAKRLGVTRQAVHLRARKLGGHPFTSWGKRPTWKFPPDTGLRVVSFEPPVGIGDVEVDQRTPVPQLAYG